MASLGFDLANLLAEPKASAISTGWSVALGTMAFAVILQSKLYFLFATLELIHEKMIRSQEVDKTYFCDLFGLLACPGASRKRAGL